MGGGAYGEREVCGIPEPEEGGGMPPGGDGPMRL